jgi:hypothetical protein
LGLYFVEKVSFLWRAEGPPEKLVKNLYKIANAAPQKVPYFCIVCVVLKWGVTIN